MREHFNNYGAAYIIFFFCFVVGLTAGQMEPVKAGDRRNPATKQESSVADMCSRVLAQKWGVGSPINRVTVIPTDDLQERDAVLGLVEFDRGYLGVYLAHEDVSKDSFMVIKKNDLPAFNECVVRLLSR